MSMTETKTSVIKEDVEEGKEKTDKEADIEKSLVIIKPDGVQKKAIGDIISRFERAGLEIEEIRMLKITEELALKHYRDHVGMPYFKRLLNYMTEEKSLVMVVSGKDAILQARKVMGPTDSTKAPKGTIRGDYGTDITINVIHGSDSTQSAEREIKIFF